MQIPKRTRRPQIVNKKCAIEGCENTFQGSYSSKYCPEHRNPHKRPQVNKAAPESVTVKNQILQHNFTEVKTVIQTCALEGCGQQFEVKVFPKQYVYPKYCPEHRNEQKRKSYLLRLMAENESHHSV